MSMKSEPAAKGELWRKGFKSSGASADYQRDNHGYCYYHDRFEQRYFPVHL
jgi:hypothetical protein